LVKKTSLVCIVDAGRGNIEFINQGMKFVLRPIIKRSSMGMSSASP
jgi:hypothetical protein